MAGGKASPAAGPGPGADSGEGESGEAGLGWVEALRGDCEPEHHWTYRREFLIRNAEASSLPESGDSAAMQRLVSFSMVWANHVFLGCRYPQQVMEKVLDMAVGITVTNAPTHTLRDELVAKVKRGISSSNEEPCKKRAVAPNKASEDSRSDTKYSTAEEPMETDTEPMKNAEKEAEKDPDKLLSSTVAQKGAPAPPVAQKEAPTPPVAQKGAPVPAVAQKEAPAPSPSVAQKEAPALSPAVAQKGAPALSPAVAQKGAPAPAVAQKGAPALSPAVAQKGAPALSPAVAQKGAPALSPAVAQKGAPALSPAAAQKGAPVLSPAVAQKGAPVPSPAVAQKGTPAPSVAQKGAPVPAVAQKGAPVPAVAQKGAPVPSLAMAQKGPPVLAVAQKGAPVPAVAQKGAPMPSLAVAQKGAPTPAVAVAQKGAPVVPSVGVKVEHRLANYEPTTATRHKSVLAAALSGPESKINYCLTKPLESKSENVLPSEKKDSLEGAAALASKSSSHVSSVPAKVPLKLLTSEDAKERQPFFNRLYKAVAWKLVAVGGFSPTVNHVELLNSSIQSVKATLDVEFVPLKELTDLPQNKSSQENVVCELRCKSVYLGTGCGKSKENAKAVASREALKLFLKKKVIVKLCKRKYKGKEIEDLVLLDEESKPVNLPPAVRNPQEIL